MTKNAFVPGNTVAVTEAEQEYEVVIPSLQTVIHMQEGSGDNLEESDYQKGLDSYIDYNILTGENAGDGGEYCYGGAGVRSWIEMISDAIKFALDIPDSEECPEFRLKAVA